MKKYFFLLIISCLTLCSCGKDNDPYTDVVIDPKIRKKVEKNISPMEFDAGEMLYKNTLHMDLYESGKLVVSTKGKAVKNPFKSFYYWKGDTLHIDGAYGLFGGFGFTMKVVEGKAILNHLLASDENPSYAYKEKDSLLYMLGIPCTGSKITLSEFPDKTKNQTIYGCVEFKSGEYFESQGFADGKEILPRQRLRADMKIYFKAGELSNTQQ